MGSEDVWVASGGIMRNKERGELARVDDGCLVTETDSANLTGSAIWVPLAAVADLLRAAGYTVTKPEEAEAA